MNYKNLYEVLRRGNIDVLRRCAVDKSIAAANDQARATETADAEQAELNRRPDVVGRILRMFPGAQLTIKKLR